MNTIKVSLNSVTEKLSVLTTSPKEGNKPIRYLGFAPRTVPYLHEDNTPVLDKDGKPTWEDEPASDTVNRLVTMLGKQALDVVLQAVNNRLKAAQLNAGKDTMSDTEKEAAAKDYVERSMFGLNKASGITGLQNQVKSMERYVALVMTNTVIGTSDVEYAELLALHVGIVKGTPETLVPRKVKKA